MNALLLRYRFVGLSFLFLVGGLLLSFSNLAFYLRFSTETIVGMIALPLIISFNGSQARNNRFFFFTLFFLVLYVWLKIQILFYSAFVFYLLFFAESAFGRINRHVFFLFLFISPFFHFFVDAFGFPVRLYLTKMVVQVMGVIIPGIKAYGNVIHCRGNEFSIDPECAGLNMLVLSLVVALAIISFHEKKEKKKISLLMLSLLLLLDIALAILANFLRMLSIILFEAFPGTVAHDFFGLLSLLVYCFVPLYFISKMVVKRSNFHEQTPLVVKEGSLRTTLLSLAILLSLIPISIFKDKFQNSFADPEIEQVEVEGFQKTVLENHVLKLSNSQCLVYIKPTVNFYGAHHSPLVCWKGGGYQLRNEQVRKVNGMEILYAEMITPQGEVLYTSWWFDNGEHKTSSQFDWRWRMLKGEIPFRLVNVTSASREELKKNELRFLNAHLFNWHKS
ncbi:MAG: exosortase N [Flavobacteriales bacterium]